MEDMKKLAELLTELIELNKNGMLKIKAFVIESDDDEIDYFVINIDNFLKMRKN